MFYLKQIMRVIRLLILVLCFFLLMSNINYVDKFQKKLI
uniref:Uncharacterized protein n=1 Tax=uncultured marine bacterium 314 TaxID=257387 RepID=Q6SHK2_9BACT|nr:hypothetical protein MBMO_EBAC750-09G06.34 [uncultured marine bacterium 314]